MRSDICSPDPFPLSKTRAFYRHQLLVPVIGTCFQPSQHDAEISLAACGRRLSRAKATGVVRARPPIGASAWALSLIFHRPGGHFLRVPIAMYEDRNFWQAFVLQGGGSSQGPQHSA
jgi:hypothetical protein